MITIKNPDKETVYGNVTIYEDVSDTLLEDLFCPCCNKPMSFERDTKITGQNTSINVFYFRCGFCHLEFVGYEDYYHFENIEDFYNFVKEKLNA